MKKAWKIIASAAVTVGLLTGCGGGSGGTAASGDTIKIGVNYELSGDVATYGQANVEGIEMATEEINNAGGIKGKKIELVKYDNKSTASEATTLATKLMTQDKVIAQIGPATSGAFKATIPVADKSKVPVVTGSATADDVTVDAQGKVQQYAFRTCFSDSYQGTAMAKYAREKKNAQSAVILTDNSSDYSKGLTASFEKTFTEAGGKVVSKQSYNKGDTDFNAILTAIRGQQFDMIYLPGYYSEAGLIIKQARAQGGITQPIVGGRRLRLAQAGRAGRQGRADQRVLLQPLLQPVHRSGGAEVHHRLQGEVQQGARRVQRAGLRHAEVRRQRPAGRCHHRRRSGEGAGRDQGLPGRHRHHFGGCQPQRGQVGHRDRDAQRCPGSGRKVRCLSEPDRSSRVRRDKMTCSIRAAAGEWVDSAHSPPYRLPGTADSAPPTREETGMEQLIQQLINGLALGSIYA